MSPMLFMSYYNPILSYGVGRRVEDCAAAGVDGFIVPDLPPEEGSEMETACRSKSLRRLILFHQQAR